MLNPEKKIKEAHNFWDVKKAGERLLFKLSPYKGNFKNFKVTEDDYNALKSLLGFINRVDSKTIYNNKLFAKLYLMELVGQIRENETTVFNDFIFTELSNQLSKPLELFYKAFYEDLCANQLNRLTKGQFTDKEGNEIIMDYKRFRETFSQEYITKKLNERMSLTLHRRS